MPLTTYRPSTCINRAFEAAEGLATSTILYHSRKNSTQKAPAYKYPDADHDSPSRVLAKRIAIALQLDDMRKPGYIPSKGSRSPMFPSSQADAQLLARGSPHSLKDSQPGKLPAFLLPPRDKVPPLFRNKLHETKYIAKNPTGVFEQLVLEQFKSVMRDRKWHRPNWRSVAKGWGIKSEEELKQGEHNFRMEISKSFEGAQKGVIDKERNPLYERLRRAFVAGDVRGLAMEVRHAFMSSVVNPRFSEEELANQRRIADLRYPTEWFPATRAMQRTIHLHVGPTNSGKTYHALQRLEAARTGIYAGPLRLLAHEVYTRFNAKGKACALVTGEERRYPENLKVVMNSCTVEMVPLNTKVDVAVIDEIQMMANEDRGWAWTQALLGVQAKEVHLCGELRTVPLIQDLCLLMGEKLEIHRYERLSPLKMSKHVGSLRNIRKGDAIIVFSRLGIHAMKTEIEKFTERRCAVVYGSLPPETRAQQANLFNDPDNDYDFLVASDAIGMGLNLAIKRVVFESLQRSNGAGGFCALETADIKQIGGRAGRYKTARDAVQGAVTDGVEDKSNTDPIQLPLPASPQNAGYVTSLARFDLDTVRKAMDTEVEPLRTAGIFPPSAIVERFASYFPPKTPFSYIVLRMHELAFTSPRFKICRLKDHLDIADAIQPFELTIHDRQIFMASPASMRDHGIPEAIAEMARCVAEHGGGELLNLKSLDLTLLDVDMDENKGSEAVYLRALESLHKILTLYLWLSYRYEGVFISQALAFHVKSLVEDRIDYCLDRVHWDIERRLRIAKRLASRREKRLEMSKDGQEVEESGQSEVQGEHTPDSDILEVDAEEADDIHEAGVVQSLEATSEEGLVGAPSELEERVPSPTDEMARVIGRGPLSERVLAQKNDESPCS